MDNHNTLHIVKTRKPHKCVKCGREIGAGKEAYRCNVRFVGVVYAHKGCKLTEDEIKQMRRDEQEEYRSIKENWGWDDVQ